jgi:hypothetical protein
VCSHFHTITCTSIANASSGYLFFTSVGILYGFKKPLAYFDFASINSIAYAAVLRNTFNLVINTQTQEIEFGMLDQADYSGINEYVQKHGLQDASLAAVRRAKKLNVNKSKNKENGNGAAAAEADDGDEEESELQKAERELEDAEDEEEEDYDPGSEGESEGSGSDSEDEDGGGGRLQSDDDGDEVDADEMEE